MIGAPEKSRVEYKGRGVFLVEPYKMVFKENRYVILFLSDAYTGTKILHNSLMQLKHNRFSNTMNKMEKKGTKLALYNTTCIGYFNSVFEAKLYIRNGRIDYLEKMLARFPTQVSRGNSTYSGTIDTETVNSVAIVKGELDKLYKWREKYAKKYPEYFI